MITLFTWLNVSGLRHIDTWGAFVGFLFSAVALGVFYGLAALHDWWKKTDEKKSIPHKLKQK